MGIVKFFCECGKEIWQELDAHRKDMTILEAEKLASCSDCLLKKLREQDKKGELT